MYGETVLVSFVGLDINIGGPYLGCGRNAEEGTRKMTMGAKGAARRSSLLSSRVPDQDVGRLVDK